MKGRLRKLLTTKGRMLMKVKAEKRVNAMLCSKTKMFNAVHSFLGLEMVVVVVGFGLTRETCCDNLQPVQPRGMPQWLR